MNPSPQTALNIENQLQASRNASRVMATLSTAEKNAALETFAQLIEAHQDTLLKANQEDKQAAQEDKLTGPLAQRLSLDASKVRILVQGLRDVIQLPDPVGHLLQKTLLDDGLILEKVSVPLGVIGIIFESRPDVIPQILSLILKSGNAVVLKGGKEAHHTNKAFMDLVYLLNEKHPKLPAAWATYLESRESVHEMLHYPQYVDLIIPRGSNQLVQNIMANTRIPVMGHADGICHVYVHPTAPLDTAVEIVVDAKSQYPSACNALETLLVDEAIAQGFLTKLNQRIQSQGPALQLVGCPKTQAILGSDIKPATEADWRTEYGDLTLSVRVVDSLEEAIDHINQFGSHHTDSILAEDPEAIQRFMAEVDSANVFANASTRFADGFRYGLGAEIGISTARTHARGPVGLEGLVIYKYKLHGQGQTVGQYSGEHPLKTFKHRPLA